MYMKLQMKLCITMHILYIYFIKKEWETHRETEKRREITKAGKFKLYRAKTLLKANRQGNYLLPGEGESCSIQVFNALMRTTHLIEGNLFYSVYLFKHCMCLLSHFSCFQLCATLWTVACQASLTLSTNSLRETYRIVFKQISGHPVPVKFTHKWTIKPSSTLTNFIKKAEQEKGSFDLYSTVTDMENLLTF